jgi:putative DNA-binding protein
MPSLAERQRAFAVALLDPGLPTPAGLVGPDGRLSARRFGVYRNNVIVGLSQTLKDAFPAVHRIVGAEFFQAMARAYVVTAPPRSPMLFDYGAGFPEFIGRFEPAAALPYLADVARLERAWVEAYHEAEASPVGSSVFAVISPEQLPALRLVLHPSVRIVRSRFPVVTIWQMNVGDGVAAPVDLEAGGENALVVRPEAEVEVRSIPPGGAEFIEALAAGRTVLRAYQEAFAANPCFDLSASLTDLIRAGALVGYRAAPESLQT